jgi:membrane protease YdiL (CAAX protease family)
MPVATSTSNARIDTPPPKVSSAIIPAVTYLAVLAAFWFTAQRFAIEVRIGGHFSSAFASFALLLLPYWAFGFGAAAFLRRVLSSPMSRVLLPGTLVVPYLVFAVPRGEVHAGIAIALIAIPISLAAIFEFAPPGAQAGLTWQDVLALLIIGVPVEFNMLRGAWPYPGLGSMAKLLVMDAALYAFLVVRQLDGVGYEFRLRLRDLAIGLREWAFYAPIAIALGLALGFITFRAYLPVPWTIATAWLITFFFVALPEELFFRGLLMNLLERRIGTRAALIASSVIFGLSHFNKPLPFNWRYVLMATIAGVFYARAWRDRRRLLSSGVTHATVDVVWSIWFR